MSRKKKPVTAVPVLQAEGEEKENLQEFRRSDLYGYAKALVALSAQANNDAYRRNSLDLTWTEDLPADSKHPIFLDKTRQLMSGGVIFKPTYRIPDEDLEFISNASVLIGSINQLFVDDVKLYSTPNSVTGFGFKYKEKEDSPTDQDKVFFKQLSRLIYLMRSDDCKAESIERYPAVLEMATRDYLNLDTVAYLITRTRAGEIYSLEYLDPKSVRRCDPKKGFHGDTDIQFVQVDVANNVVETFEKGRIILRHKNNLSGLYHRYFGFSPLESCITEIMGQLYAARRNNEKFNVRSVPKKMMTSSQKVSPQEKELIERTWENAFYAAASGSSVRIPMIFGMSDIQVHDLDWKTEDFYDSFMQWVCSMILARYGVDSAMLGLNFNKSQALSEASMDGRQKTSRDRIIGAMMSAHASDMNDILDPDYSEKWQFTFNGVVQDDESKKADVQKKQIGVSKTLDEIRTANDDPTWEQLGQTYFPDDKKKQEQLKAFGLMVSDPQMTPKLSEILFGEADGNAGPDGQPGGEQPTQPDAPPPMDESEMNSLYEASENSEENSGTEGNNG